MFRDGMATDNPPHDWIEAEPVGIVHVVVAAEASENGLAELPDKTVATVLPTTGSVSASPAILVNPTASSSSRYGNKPASEVTLELKLQATVNIEPQNRRFRFTHRVCHINTQNLPIT